MLQRKWPRFDQRLFPPERILFHTSLCHSTVRDNGVVANDGRNRYNPGAT
jgi:hypothetical protein